MSHNFVNLPYDVYHHIISNEAISVLDVVNLKQTCRALRTSLILLLSEHPAIYRDKLSLLVEKIPTGLPKDLSSFTSAQLEAAALSSYAVERRWRAASPKISCVAQVYEAYIPTAFSPLKVTVLKVLPGGRWLMAALECGTITVWDTIKNIVVAQVDHVWDVYWIAFEMVGPDCFRMAIPCAEFDFETREYRPSLAAYLLRLDPPPTSPSLSIIQAAPTDTLVENPAIKGSIICATYPSELGLGLVIYNWKEKMADAFNIHLTPIYRHAFGRAPELVLLPGKILIYQRWADPPFLHVVHMSQSDDREDIRHALGVIPGTITQTAEGFGPGNDLAHSVCNVVETIRSPTTMSLFSLAIDTHSPFCIMFESTQLTSDPVSESVLMESRPLFSRHVQVRNCVPTEGSSYSVEPFRPLTALGHTGKRAVWVESSLENGRGGLVGFTAPVGVSTEVCHGAAEVGEDAKQQTMGFFQEASPLRRLPTPGIASFADTTAVGFDETTGTVAFGDVQGQILLFDYGSMNAVRMRHRNTQGTFRILPELSWKNVLGVIVTFMFMTFLLYLSHCSLDLPKLLISAGTIVVYQLVSSD